MRAETPSEQLFFTTVYIIGQDDGGHEWTGTGFLVDYPLQSGGSAIVLVTNKHVLRGATTLTMRMVLQAADGTPAAGATQMRMVHFSDATWTGHPDPDVDVAVMNIAAVLNQMADEGRTPFFRTIPASMLLTHEQAQELDALEEVTFLGYPNGLFDTHSFLPIARRGQTATPIQNDYRGKPAFLIDASVFGGSSGSPVFIANRGVYASRNGTVRVASRMHLLGVVAAVHTRQTTGEIHDLPARGIAVFQEGIDLGIVYKASAIQQCVELLASAVGVVLADSTTPLENLA